MRRYFLLLDCYGRRAVTCEPIWPLERRIGFRSSFMAIRFTNELNTQTTTSGGLTGVVTDESKAVAPDADEKRSPWGV